MKHETKRLLGQTGAVVGMNAYVPGFINGTIFQGPTKAFCVPGLNCYSCPGALASCPIGSLQAVLASMKYSVSLYVTGLLLLFGMIAGRWICGWLCPFGWLQDLLHRIPGRKLKVPQKVSWLRFAKYAVLISLVILLPMLAVNEFGQGDPWFCKYLCPSGTVFAGIPLTAANENLRLTLGLLFAWKMTIAGLILAASVFIYRFFCRFLCPLGAIYGLLNRISLYRMRIYKERCTSCGACKEACKIQIDPVKTPNSIECIRCGACTTACPNHALCLSFSDKAKGKQAQGESRA
jgi:ferredoxin-type protein NapH